MKGKDKESEKKIKKTQRGKKSETGNVMQNSDDKIGRAHV